MNVQFVAKMQFNIIFALHKSSIKTCYLILIDFNSTYYYNFFCLNTRLCNFNTLWYKKVDIFSIIQDFFANLRSRIEFCSYRLFLLRSSHYFLQINQNVTTNYHCIYPFCTSIWHRNNLMYKMCKLGDNWGSYFGLIHEEILHQSHKKNNL